LPNTHSYKVPVILWIFKSEKIILFLVLSELLSSSARTTTG
jgi:hypothetical protein